MTVTRVPDGPADCRRIHDHNPAYPLGADSTRLRAEFLSMPGLCLTVPQVARLLAVPLASATTLLADLEDDGFLICTASGYRLAQPFLA